MNIQEEKPVFGRALWPPHEEAGGCGWVPPPRPVHPTPGAGAGGRAGCPGGWVSRRRCLITTALLSPWAGGCFFWKGGKQESSRGLQR